MRTKKTKTEEIIEKQSPYQQLWHEQDPRHDKTT
jgi:hypothetical protein